MYQKIPRKLELPLIECNSAVVRCECDDNSDLTRAHLLIQSFSPIITYAQVLVITIILLSYDTLLITLIIMSYNCAIIFTESYDYRS